MASLWPLPVLSIVLALVAGVLLPRMDQLVDDALSVDTRIWIFGGGPDAARTVLSAVAGSLITVTSLTFSLTVVTLQLASSQFSPRLLRTFSSDPFVHVTLSMFLATFVYSLVVLRTVRDNTDSGGGFVPRISVTVAVGLTVASVVALVLFLAHLARQIRVETMLSDVHEDATSAVSRVLEAPSDDPAERTAAPEVPDLARSVPASASGFLTSVDEQDLLDAACAAGVVVRVTGCPGDSVVQGTPVAWWWPRDEDGRSPEDDEDLARQVAGAVYTGPERTASQDIAYGLRQMTDVAVKALSPGINDPTTAVYALGHMSALLCEMTQRQLGPKLLHDDDGVVRVVLERPGLAELLDLAVAQPRRYGSDAPDVLARLTQLLREVGWRARDAEQRDVVESQRRRLRATVAAADLDETEHAELARLDRAVSAALLGRWEQG